MFNAAWIFLGVLVLFFIAFRFYGRFLNRTFQINNNDPTPAHTEFDGVDFIPAKNWWVLFGHHFSSICGAGPILGPVFAVIFWGWAPSLIWVVLGAMLMGAVADYASLVLSMKAKGLSIAKIADHEISPLASKFFSWFIWVALILVVAVFATEGAKTLVSTPQVVLPSLGIIPIALIVGLFLKKGPVLASLFGVGALFLLMYLGQLWPIDLETIFGKHTYLFWLLTLLLYCLIASVLPVDKLLQPRDYISSFLLFLTIGFGIVSVFVTQPSFSFDEASFGFFPENANGPLFPMLFVTIACGAISGFHSLVSSGTTCKQISCQSHALRIGYGGMLLEGIVAVLVIICVGAVLGQEQTKTILQNSSAIGVFGEGYGQLVSYIMGSFGITFAVLALNTFILTTLDSATRITRYLTTDLFKIKMWPATFLVVILAGLLAYSGQSKLIWPVFGTANQLIAGIALLVSSCWLLKRGQTFWPVLIPAFLMLITTFVAFSWQIWRSLAAEKPKYILAFASLLLIVLAIVILQQVWNHFKKQRLA